MKKLVFRAYQKWIGLRQTKTKMTNGPFYRVAQIEILPAEKFRYYYNG